MIDDKNSTADSPNAAPTPGPWKVATTTADYQEDHCGLICIEHPDWDAEDVVMPRWAVSLKEHQANAHLIAAAPELFEALRESLHYLEEFVQGEERLHEKVRAVLAKAEGRS